MKSEADKLVDGRPGDGTATQWYESGQIRVEARYSKGEMTGSYTKWHENGRIEDTGRYAKDQRVGRHISFHPNGMQRSIGIFDEGLDADGVNKRKSCHGWGRQGQEDDGSCDGVW